MFKFIVNTTGKSNSGSVVYSKEENSFDFIPSRNADIIMLLGYLHVGIDSETMSVQQVWGLSPFESWNKKALIIPAFSVGELLLDGDLQPGMTYRIAGSETWTTNFDSKSGWFCVGDCETIRTDNVIEFANNSVAVISDGLLKALWLRPAIE
ncbi:MAG: hypothetical protein NHB14_10040 [Desulfosporosinus sp.]|nr:hypothetical protein [Desulfosporosinus sp.]MDA8221002.1 hypothetical protein [Desulfitobacterium hafniense]